MTKYEKWQTRYKEVIGFIETNPRNPSKYHMYKLYLIGYNFIKNA